MKRYLQSANFDKTANINVHNCRLLIELKTTWHSKYQIKVIIISSTLTH